MTIIQKGEPMDDLISRQAAIDALRGYLVGKRCPDDGTLTCRLIENEVINKLPTIHPEHGTNLAEVGKDVPDINVGEFISRQVALVAVKDALMAWSYMPEWRDEEILEAIAEFPSAQPTSSKMEQVPTRCNLIDRQAAINKILGQPPEPHYPSWYAEQIKELPTAEPKKSRGKWIEDKGQQTLMRNFIEMGEVWRVCSVCGAGHMIGHKYAIDKAYHDRHHNFCPNCGAKMEVNSESN